MKSRTVALAVTAFSAAMIVATFVLWALGGFPPVTPGWGTEGIQVILTLLPVSFTAVGALIAIRQPGNRVGWVCLGLGVVLSIPTTDYGAYARETGSLPGAEIVTWIGDWAFLPGVGGVTFLLLLFPDGRLLSPRWRWVAYASGIAVVLAVFSEAFRPGILPSAPGVANPFPLEAAKYIPGHLEGGANVLLAPCFAAGAASLVLRFRRARGRERLQIKWLASAAALLAALFALVGVGSLVAGLLDAGEPLGLRVLEDFVSLSASGLPIAIGIAVLRHDLYEIDVVINRTLVYGGLTATLAATYLGSVLLLQLVLRPVTADSNLAIAVSTLAVAGLFRPARARIQSAVDRRFYRRKYDAQRTLEDFSSRLRDEVDLGAMDAELGRAVRETLQPAHVSLWLAPRRSQ